MPLSDLRADVPLALALIAAELGIDADALPQGIAGVLRSLSNAHYQAGVSDGMARRTGAERVHDASSNVTSSDATPIVGPYGRRRFASATEDVRTSQRPTPLRPPPPFPAPRRKNP